MHQNRAFYTDHMCFVLSCFFSCVQISTVHLKFLVCFNILCLPVIYMYINH